MNPKVAEAVCLVAGVDEVEATDLLVKDLGLDSLDLLSLAYELNRSLGTDFAVEEFGSDREVVTVGMLAEWVEWRLQGGQTT